MSLNISVLDILDIVLITFILYNVFLLIKDTPAVQIIKGFVVLFIFSFIANWLGLRTINWLIKGLMAMLVVAIPIIFQPELRRLLLKMGKGGFLSNIPLFRQGEETKQWEELINGIIMVVPMLSAEKNGALIVLEREVGLQDILETGITLNSDFSSELLYSIFLPNSPLHDGAVIIRNNRIAGANCILPLTKRTDLKKYLGTRHRAAIGLSETTDALIVVVSEERGAITVAIDGKLTRPMKPQLLKKFLQKLYHPKRIKLFDSAKKGNQKND
ncbi:MAG: diadenylate cyclase CdaA [Candidatus Caldatribacteriota bacterium]|jgi:diadenylate cyclase|nr:diadenylate cyclase CdaA [Atribacterota bacterium]MDD3030896.1 diadenylate cyclase CdaA [Atribacterota bacterium]MDD3640686.1 diadenylate cyclase CdaA [Atribacterota bacterium]MDD4288468.1 diadenylate cyclase CdaA [Atribacterota bacterium]MDD4764301.1 diadenylate cyclase CdaA [Atribacterota bacterium]